MTAPRATTDTKAPAVDLSAARAAVSLAGTAFLALVGP